MNYILTDDIREKLRKLWFIYGNNGSKHTHGNHRYIQDQLEKYENGDITEKVIHDQIIFMTQGRSKLYKPLTEECIEAVNKVYLE